MLGDSPELRRLIEPVLDSMGFDLLMAELTGGRRPILRLYIDAPGGVVLADCESVSRQVSALLDVEDPIEGDYTLEVSSPGLDRPLVTAAHFEAARGKNVRIKMNHAQAGRRRFSGRLLTVESDGVEVECDGEVYALPFSEMNRANLVAEI
jgi:ribosome maturation factor RimP